MKTKVLAIYLPQFHTTPENDEWWGEGFTEWTAVRSAKPLFEGHNQPRIPLNGNYYNLLNYDTMAWQAGLMKKYHIDGVCIYHYWFEDGKRILEKPAENLLKWKNIQMPFCFCWANETWSRTWKKFMNTNVWINNNNMAKKNILLRQIYGREREWEEHFQYLLPFFQDDRYIKLDGKPVFVILKQTNIFQLWEMMNYFDKLAKENGLQGLHIVGMETNWMNGLDAVCIRQPRSAMAEYQKKYNYVPQGLQIYPYNEICKIQIETKNTCKPTYYSCAVDYDSTPRMGQNGVLLQDTSLEKFYECFDKLYQKSLMLRNEFLFINAWNEWGEGMYLEPDEKNGYGYLNSVREIVEKNIKGEKSIDNTNAYFINDKEFQMDKDIQQESLQRLARHDKLLDNWMRIRDYNINFAGYFKKYGYHNIAIYGMGRLGTHLLRELRESEINVIFGIDKNNQNTEQAIDIYNPLQEMPEVDAVVITILDEYKEVGDLLKKSMNCSMICLEEIVQELLFYCES